MQLCVHWHLWLPRAACDRGKITLRWGPMNTELKSAILKKKKRKEIQKVKNLLAWPFFLSKLWDGMCWEIENILMGDVYFIM